MHFTRNAVPEREIFSVFNRWLRDSFLDIAKFYKHNTCDCRKIINRKSADKHNNDETLNNVCISKDFVSAELFEQLLSDKNISETAPAVWLNLYNRVLFC